MPLLLNKETNSIERLPSESYQQALESGTHEVYMVEPEGNIVSVPYVDAIKLQAKGYRQPNEKEFKNIEDYAKFSTPKEQLKTFAQNVAKTATLGLSTGVQRALGDKPEDILAREEVNPGTKILGEIAGLVAPTPGGKFITSAGEGAAKALGLGTASTLPKVGSYAARAATENAILTGVDEVSKAFAKDPDQRMGSVASHVGMNAIIGAGAGAALGSLHPLWKAAKETSLGEALGAIRNKVNGDTANIPSPIKDAIKQSGVDVPDQIKTILEDHPKFRGWFQTLMHGETHAAKDLQKMYHDFRKGAVDTILESLGKNEAFVKNLSNVSAHQAGELVKQTLIKEIDPFLQTIQKSYDPISEQFSKIPLPEVKGPYGETLSSAKNDLLAKFGEISEKIGASKNPSSPQAKILNEAIQELPLQQNLEDLRLFGSNIGKKTGSFTTPDLHYVGGLLQDAIKDIRSTVLTDAVKQKAPGLLGELEASNTLYKNLRGMLTDLNQELKVGKFSGPKSFLDRLNKMTGEDVLRKMTPKDNAKFLDTLSTEFPKSASVIRDTFVNQALKAASKTAGQDILKPSVLSDMIFNKWSPELRAFALPGEAQKKIEAIKTLLDAVPKNKNPSGSAGMAAELFKRFPSEVAAAVSLLVGKNPISGYVLGALGKLVSRELPDTAKVGLFKFLGSEAPINAGAFKTMVDFADAAALGQNKMEKGVRSLFKTADSLHLTELSKADKDRFQAKIDEYAANPSELLKVGGEIGHYLPEDAIALTKTASTAVEYLEKIKPKEDPLGGLDGKRIPSQAEVAQYERQLSLVNQPLTIFSFMKNGTITSKDVETLKIVYPGFYEQVSELMMSEVVNTISEDKIIPYILRLSISRFLQTPLDSTMTPKSILSNQPKQGAALPSQIREQNTMKSLGKIADQSKTGLQSRQEDHVNN